MMNLKTLGQINARMDKLSPRAKRVLLEAIDERLTADEATNVAYVVGKVAELDDAGSSYVFSQLQAEVADLPAPDGPPAADHRS